MDEYVGLTNEKFIVWIVEVKIWEKNYLVSSDAWRLEWEVNVFQDGTFQKDKLTLKIVFGAIIVTKTIFWEWKIRSFA